jgi:hypothetical protein
MEGKKIERFARESLVWLIKKAPKLNHRRGLRSGLIHLSVDRREKWGTPLTGASALTVLRFYLQLTEISFS